MMFRFLRLTCATLLCVVLAAPAGATISRVRSLGGSGDDFEDDSNVLRWPGSLVDYTGVAALDLGTWNLDTDGRSTGRGGHLFASLGRAGCLGLAFADELPEPDPGGYFSAIFAHSFGPLTPAVSFRGSTYGAGRDDLGDRQFAGQTSYLHNWGGGLRWDAGDGLYLDAAAEWIRAEIEFADESSGRRNHELSSESYAARVRAFARLNDRLILVPRFEYTHDVRPVVGDPLGDIADFGSWRVRAGTAFNVLLDPDNLLIASAEYFRNNRDWQARDWEWAAADDGWRDAWYFAVRFGVESRLLPWLSARAGAAYRRQTDEWTLREHLSGNEVDFIYNWNVEVDVPVSVGLGAHLGGFDCDLDLSEGAPLGDRYLPAGVAPIEKATRASLTLRYEF
jgi:hypothetical protein